MTTANKKPVRRASSCTVGADVVRGSRAETAGRATGTALVEMVHLMYQNNTAANFWRGLMDVLTANGRKPPNASLHGRAPARTVQGVVGDSGSGGGE
jgi:hypothetical protein